jgi:hypothetical protein
MHMCVQSKVNASLGRKLAAEERMRVREAPVGSFNPTGVRI